MQIIIYILSIFLGIYPTELFGIGKLSIFQISILFIYFYYLFLVIINSQKISIYGQSITIYFIIFMAFILSIFKMIFVSNLNFTRPAFHVLNYFLFFIILFEIKNTNQIKIFLRKLLPLLIISMIISIVFYIFPSLLNISFFNNSMGYIQSETPLRIFTPNMPYIALFMLFLLVKIVIKKNINIILFVTTTFVILIVFSVRVHQIGIFVGLIILLLITKKFNFINVAMPLLVMLLFYLVLPQTYSEYIFTRIAKIINLENFDFWGAYSNNVLYGGNSFGTFYWRIYEINYTQQFINTMPDQIFGVIGTTYNLTGLQNITDPHIGYYGLYFLFGIFGVVCFFIYIVYFLIKSVKLIRYYRNTEHYDLALFLFLAWINLLIYSVSSGIFYSHHSAIFAITSAFIIIMEKDFKKKNFAK